MSSKQTETTPVSRVSLPSGCRKVLVTGGAGYIGSHTCVALLDAGYQVVVVDNFCNSHPESLKRIQAITGRSLQVHEADLRDQTVLTRILRASGVEAVIHFAGLKAVGESVAQPLRYYDNNVHGTRCLVQSMSDAGVYKLVFSSSATVYGEPESLPMSENHPLRTTNPYGQTKWVIEEMLRDVHRSDAQWQITLLRYFNPVGAHPSGQLGEDPRGVPNNLMPFVSQVAIGRRDCLNVWGADYPTPDGTGVRDYIHVMDLAQGHLRALECIQTAQCVAINLGTGRGHSVLDVVHAYERVSGRKIPVSIQPRRPGDVAACYADAGLAQQLLGWRAAMDLDQMCRDAWRWQQNNPDGYGN